MTEPFAGCPRITGRPSLRRARIPRLCKRLQDPDRMWRRTCSGGETPTRHAILKEADFQRSRNPVWAFSGVLAKRIWLSYAGQASQKCHAGTNGGTPVAHKDFAEPGNARRKSIAS